MNVISKERLTELLDVFPEEGKMVWKPRVGPSRVVTAWNLRFAGRVAGSLHQNGYLTVHVDGKVFKAHRLIWLFVHGEMPGGLIDHISGDAIDNRISNLRVATKIENAKNAKISSKNTSGCPGVCWAADIGRWKVRVQTGGVPKTIGHYAELSDAIAARKAAERQHGYHENHGRAA